MDDTVIVMFLSLGWQMASTVVWFWNKKGRKCIGSVRYNKLCKLAVGSFGAQIYVGYKDRQAVAVKRVCSEFVKAEVDVIQSLKGTKMSHVLQPLCCLHDDDFTYIVTPLCEYNLEEVIGDKSCPIRSLIQDDKRMVMCNQLLKGLKELHDTNILHRDLKPKNVLLGKYKLLFK